ncbi:GIY-YIG nuclease family protein [Burkholderia sp. SR8]|uniref:GIY-YIG nuclease family protein n=1 Tax=Burkholderia sp. SR8 TaxID=3062277 RepID=UPI00406327BB
MSWFLYLIECADDSVYTGITTDVAARFDEHACGKGARYTRSRKPRAVLASFPLPDRSIASRAEYWVKRLTAAQKRELAAGIRTLESVLPMGMSIDGSIDADAVQAASRGKKKAAKTVTKKVQSIDVAAPVAKAERPRQKAAKAEKAGNDGTASPSAKTRAAKPGQASPTPTRAKLAAAAQRANMGDAAEVKKTASRSAAAKRKKPATRAAPKRKTPAAGGNPVAQEHGGTIAKPARRRASPGRSTAEAVEAAAAVATQRRATGATRAMDVTGTTDAPRATRAKAAPTAAALPAPASPRKNTTARAVPRTKQNRAAS